MSQGEMVCKRELKVAMAAQLGKDAKYLDDPRVDGNFAALGSGLNQILTVNSHTWVDLPAHEELWKWLHAVSKWQRGVLESFKDWEPTEESEIQLREDIVAFPAPDDPPKSAIPFWLWLQSLAEWQTGVIEAFEKWTPTLENEQLRTEILELAPPGDLPAFEEMIGRIEIVDENEQEASADD